MKEFKGSTIGMMAYHQNLNKSVLVRVEYYKTEAGMLLVPVSGNNLAVIKQIKQVCISSESFNDRDYDYYNDQVELEWALKQLHFEMGEH